MRSVELFDLIEKLEGRNNSYWNFYTIVIIAVCGWVLTRDVTQVSNATKMALLGGNALFYFMNLSIIYGTTRRLVALEQELHVVAAKDQQISPALKTHLATPFLKFRLPATVATHLLMDIAVLVFIYLRLGAGTPA